MTKSIIFYPIDMIISYAYLCVRVWLTFTKPTDEEKKMRRRRDQIPLASFCEWVIEVHAAYAMISQVYSTMVLMSCILFEIMIFPSREGVICIIIYVINTCVRASPIIFSN